MPDYRLIHRRALRGEKVGKLTDFERGVWLAYLLIADDFGVMPFDAGELAQAVWLKGKPQKTVRLALERVRDVGLIQTWTHQGALYCYACDWQEWQNVRHPRGTIEPCPPPDVLALCKPKTRELFASHSRSHDEELPQDSGNLSGEFGNLPRLARAAGRETLSLTANATANAERGPGETRPRASGAGNRGGVGAGSFPGDHLSHLACGPVCFTPRMTAKFIGRFGGDRDRLTAWARRTCDQETARVDAGQTPSFGDDFAYWTAAYDLDFGKPARDRRGPSHTPADPDKYAGIGLGLGGDDD